MTIFGEKTQQKRKFECLKRSGLEYDERNKNLKNYKKNSECVLVYVNMVERFVPRFVQWVV